MLKVFLDELFCDVFKGFEIGIKTAFGGYELHELR
jgi:hypothetical protein